MAHPEILQRSSVERAIRMVIARNEAPRIDLVAEVIGISVRTLQRRLADTGWSFRMLLEQSRLAAAVQVLQHTDAKVVDIALGLGYSEHAHFSRAFRRSMGLAPREYRRWIRTMRSPHPSQPSLEA
jgi:AraC-like DNA-binding protein